jgi:hypothetical protein
LLLLGDLSLNLCVEELRTFLSLKFDDLLKCDTLLTFFKLECKLEYLLGVLFDEPLLRLELVSKFLNGLFYLQADEFLTFIERISSSLLRSFVSI